LTSWASISYLKRLR